MMRDCSLLKRKLGMHHVGRVERSAIIVVVSKFDCRLDVENVKLQPSTVL